MKRNVIKIDEEKCNGCGLCVRGCHEGALQLIDGKAVMISDIFCDGLGACIGECPEGAIEIEKREALPYDEIEVMKRIAPKGEKVIKAHLKHMKDHNEITFLKQGITYLKDNNIEIDISDLEPIYSESNQTSMNNNEMPHQVSKLRNWPIELHLQSPTTSYFEGANLVLAADCTAFSFPDFHRKFMENKTLSIACPKLDSNKEIYIEKLIAMIDVSKIDTLTVIIMEVPCCSGLVRIASIAREGAKRNIPIKVIKISIKGEILEEVLI